MVAPKHAAEVSKSAGRDAACDRPTFGVRDAERLRPIRGKHSGQRSPQQNPYSAREYSIGRIRISLVTNRYRRT
jgi:hypothetical protein